MYSFLILFSRFFLATDGADIPDIDDYSGMFKNPYALDDDAGPDPLSQLCRRSDLDDSLVQSAVV